MSPPARTKPAVDWEFVPGPVAEYLDDMTLRHAIETAEALTDEEQEKLFAEQERAESDGLLN